MAFSLETVMSKGSAGFDREFEVEDATIVMARDILAVVPGNYDSIAAAHGVHVHYKLTDETTAFQESSTSRRPRKDACK